MKAPEDLAAAETFTRVLYLTLVSRADALGNLHGDARYWAGYLDVSLAEVRSALAELVRLGRLKRVGVVNSEWKIADFAKYYKSLPRKGGD